MADRDAKKITTRVESTAVMKKYTVNVKVILKIVQYKRETRFEYQFQNRFRILLIHFSQKVSVCNYNPFATQYAVDFLDSFSSQIDQKNLTAQENTEQIYN